MVLSWPWKHCRLATSADDATATGNDNSGSWPNDAAADPNAAIWFLANNNAIVVANADADADAFADANDYWSIPIANSSSRSHGISTELAYAADDGTRCPT